MNISVLNLLDLSHTLAGDYLKGFEYPWEALKGIKDLILSLEEELDREEFYLYPGSEDVWIAKDAVIFSNANISGPAIIGHRTQVRPGAFIRGSALVGDDCVVGNSTELKNVILFDHVQVPHYNYVGDSLLGYKAHMGAGSITSNVKSDKTLVAVKDGEFRYETGLKKFGAVLGDRVEVGCNSVLNPGTIIGRDTSIYPLSSVRGVIGSCKIYKGADNIVSK